MNFDDPLVRKDVEKIAREFGITVKKVIEDCELMKTSFESVKEKTP